MRVGGVIRIRKKAPGNGPLGKKKKRGQEMAPGITGAKDERGGGVSAAAGKNLREQRQGKTLNGAEIKKTTGKATVT